MAVISIFVPGIASERHKRGVRGFWLKLLVLVLTGATGLAAWGPESSLPLILRPEVWTLIQAPRGGPGQRGL